MKKIFALVLAVAMMLALVACGGSNNTKNDAANNTQNTTDNTQNDAANDTQDTTDDAAD